MCIASNPIGLEPAVLILALTTITTLVIYLGFAYLALGHIDPLFDIAAFVGAALSAAIGAVTLWIMHKARRRKT